MVITWGRGPVKYLGRPLSTVSYCQEHMCEGCVCMCYGVGVYGDLQMDNVHQRTTAMLEMCICLLAEEAPEQSQRVAKNHIHNPF